MTSLEMQHVGPTERTLVKASRFVMAFVLGYVIGFGSAQPVVDWIRAAGKLPSHATVPTHALSEKPTIELADPDDKHPSPKEAK